MDNFSSNSVKCLSPYVPGEQQLDKEFIKLNTNENPYPPSNKVFDALHSGINEKLRLYPDPESEELKQCIAQYYGLNKQQVFIGNGSDEVLAHSFLAFFKKNKAILFPDITYSFYSSYCCLYNIEYKQIPVDDYFQISIDDYLIENGGIIFPNPNAPTGSLKSLAEIKKLLLLNTKSVVIIDEAYIDFGGQSAVSLIKEHPNLLIIQTFSKSRSLAGLRIGFAMGDINLIETLSRVKNSFNSYPLDRLAGLAAIAAINDQYYFEETKNNIIKSRRILQKDLVKLGFNVLPSSANFLFVHHPLVDACQLVSELRSRNILVRHFNLPRMNQFLRITVGTEKECNLLVKALSHILLKI